MKKYEGFKRYKVKVWLEEEYYGITAKNEEDAFIQASNLAIDAGCWGREIEEIGDVEREEEVKEMTIAEIEKELGYSIKVVKEKENE